MSPKIIPLLRGLINQDGGSSSSSSQKKILYLSREAHFQIYFKMLCVVLGPINFLYISIEEYWSEGQAISICPIGYVDLYSGVKFKDEWIANMLELKGVCKRDFKVVHF